MVFNSIHQNWGMKMIGLSWVSLGTPILASRFTRSSTDFLFIMASALSIDGQGQFGSKTSDQPSKPQNVFRSEQAFYTAVNVWNLINSMFPCACNNRKLYYDTHWHSIFLSMSIIYHQSCMRGWHGWEFSCNEVLRWNCKITCIYMCMPLDQIYLPKLVIDIKSSKSCSTIAPLGPTRFKP